MTTCSFGEILLVPFPFTDQSDVKKRPAVVVSSNAYNRERPDIVIMAVTSQVRSANYLRDIAVSQWKEAGLLKPSVIKPIFITIEKGLVIKKLGNLKEKDQASLKEALQTILG